MQDVLSRSVDAVRQLLRQEVGEGRFDLWLKNTVLSPSADDTVEVGTPNVFVKEWLAQNYAAVIRSAFERSAGVAVQLRFVVDTELARRFQEAAGLEDDEAPAGTEPVRAPALDEEARCAALGLKPDFRLETFVVGACNRLALGAARSVCEEPGTAYNPLFIYGSSGLGKTHILQGMARAFGRAHGFDGVLYLSCESFVNHFIESLKAKRIHEFRNRFRTVRFLVIDDVHVLANKEATQEEFLHTFNACFHQGHQIVMASDSHPNAIAQLRRELKGRFISGLLARLDPPSYLTRLAILREKSSRLGLALPEEVLAYLAHHIRSNVRVLEGALTILAARAMLLRETLSVEEAAEVLRVVEEKIERIITLGDVEDAVLARFAIASQDLHSRSRKRDFLVPRQVCMALARRLTSHSLSEIGQYFGKRDHVTVLYALRRIEEAVSADPAFAKTLEDLEDRIRHPEPKRTR